MSCTLFLSYDAVEDLSKMYKLYHKIPILLDCVVKSFKKHITSAGEGLVNQAEDGIKEDFVTRFIELHDKLMKYVNDCFLNNKLFLKSLNESFEILCSKNVGGSPIAELFATFCDNLLKKGASENQGDEASENQSDEVNKETLKKVVMLVECMEDDEKHLFKELYREKLARRLLSDMNYYEEGRDKWFLTELEEKINSEYTYMMKHMVADMTPAPHEQLAFEAYLHEKGVNLGIDLTVTALNKVCWPAFETFDFKPPSEMVECVEAFDRFTANKKVNHTWIYSLGTCSVMGQFHSNAIELVASPLQAAILQLFNCEDKLTYAEIRCKLNMSDEDILCRMLLSLSCEKHNILLKEPKTPTINPNDSFEYNFKFTSADKKINIKVNEMMASQDVLQVVEKKAASIEDVHKH